MSQERLVSLKLLLESSSDAIIVIDEEGLVKDFNIKAIELLGYDDKELINQKVEVLYPSREACRIIKLLRKSNKASIKNIKTWIMNKNGDKIPIMLNAAFIFEKGLKYKTELTKGKKFSSIGYFRDMRAEMAFIEITKNIASIKNEKEILNKIVEIISRTMKAEACSILIYNEQSRRLETTGNYGIPEKLKNSKRGEYYSENEGMTGAVFNKGKTVNISNINVPEREPRYINIKWRYAQNFQEHSRFKDFRHFLGTPLKIRGEVFGVLRILNKYHNMLNLDNIGFKEEDVRQFELIASQLSFLIENIRNKERFNAIFNVGIKINEKNDMPIDHLIKTIAEEVVKGMRFRACYLRLIEDGNMLRIKACYGLKGDYTENKKYDIKIGTGVSGIAVKSGKIINIPDILKDKRFIFKHISREEKLRSMLCVPLKFQNKVVGTINCYSSRIHKFTEQEIQIIKTFASYAIIAIQNRKRLDELFILKEIGDRLVKPFDRDALFNLILRNAKWISGADRVCIKLYDDRFGEIKSAGALNCKWNELHKNNIIRLGEGIIGSIAEKVVKNKTSQIVKYSKFREKIKDIPDYEFIKDIKSIAIVPIKINEKVYGLIFIESSNKDIFTKDDLIILENFSIQAAIALRNVIIINKLQRIAQALPKISEPDKNIEKVLETITKIASEVLETDVLVLYRYDDKHDRIIWPPTYYGDIKYPKFMKNEVDNSSVPLIIINKRKSRYASNTKDDSVMGLKWKKYKRRIPQRFVFRERIVSSAGIILKVGKEIVGIMFLNYRKKHNFSKDEKQIIKILSSYISIAIENVKHFCEKEIADATSMLGRIAGEYAHKIKNDLGTINLYASDLIDGIKSDSPQYFPLTNIRETIDKISIDINDMLKRSKLKIYKKEITDICGLINEVKSEMINNLNNKKIKFEIKEASNLPKIKIDSSQIKLVISDLVCNSISAMPKGGKISVFIERIRNIILIKWTDSGHGILPEYAYKIFDFSYTTKSGGFGLGLYYARRIIEEHGGSIFVDTDYKKGARFIIRLPIE